MHPHGMSSAPPLFSAVRIATLLTSLLVSLGSGTNYVFSAYGPQLAARLHLSHTQMNIVGLSGNVGVYGTAPFWGRTVDSRGPRMLLALAFFALLIGYNGMKHFYDQGIPEGAKDISTLTFCGLVLCGFLTGIGGNGGLTSAMNSTAKSFPDSLRGTTAGLVISGFGLSAFLFSSIAHIIFPGNTSEFLLVLAIGTSLPMILGFFFVRPIPLPHSDYTRVEDLPDEADDDNEEEDDFSSASPAIFQRENNSHTHLLGAQENDFEDDVLGTPERRHSHERMIRGSVVALSPTRPAGSRQRSRSSLAVSRRDANRGLGKTADGQPNIRGAALVGSQSFWLLFVITSLLAGTGLMYINNVGSISQALFAKGDSEFDERKAAKWQATQVSTVSITNCIGRILIGMIADSTKNHLKLPRSFCISLVAVIFIISQLMVYAIDDVRHLWRGSALLGLAYGGLFGLFPTITIEWFGLPHFSENWGFVSLSPMIGGNVFSIAFGRNLDAHAPSEPSLNNTTILATGAEGSDSSHQCLQGKECYVGSLQLTIAACSLALVLSIYAGWRDYREGKRRARVRYAPVVTIWEAPEE